MKVKSIRGNLQTRLRKLDEGGYSALILAAAGMKRLGLEDRIYRYFTTEEMIPAAGQGILAVQGRKGMDYGFLDGFADPDSWAAGRAERAFVRRLDGGCSSPIAAYGEIKNGELILTGLYYREEMGTYITGSISGSASKPEELGTALAERLKESQEKGELS